jgi:hypothetical protein
MDIFEKIKNFVASHKKVSIAVLVLTLVSAICISSYVVSTNKQTVNTEKVTETTKKDSSTKKEDKKSDEKKNDSKKNETKKDEKKEDKKSDVTENKTTTDNTVTEENKTVENKNVENISNNTSNNVSNSTSNNSTPSQPTSTPCVPTYTTVNHEATGHYETQVISEAWDEPVYDRKIVGLTTGRVYNSVDDFLSQDEDGNYTVKDVQVDTIHHDAVTQQVWVVDQPAWTETVASGC